MKLRVRPKPWHELAALVAMRAFAVVGAASVLQQLFSAIPGTDALIATHWRWLISAVVIAATMAGLSRVFQPQQVTFRARGTQLEIEIKTGDLFTEAANIAIPVNDFFDTELGKPVSLTTVHGQFISRIFPDEALGARTAVDAALIGKQPIETIRRARGAARRFKIGETANIKMAGHVYVLVALSQTDPESCQVTTSPSQLITALEGLWDAVRACCNHEPISIPLMGAGTSRTGFPKAALLDFILSTAIRAQQVSPVAKKLSVVLRVDDLSEVDLFEVKRRYG